MVGSVKPADNFDAEADSDALRAAFKGLGCDGAALIRIMCKRSADQRVKIASTYKTMFGRDLLEDIRRETRGNFKAVLLALSVSKADYLASVCRNAIKGVGTNEGALINVLVGATNEEIQEIRAAYENMTGEQLEREIQGDTMGTLKRVLVGLAQGRRSGAKESASDKVVADGEALYKAGMARVGTDTAVFNKILVMRSPAHLLRVFEYYRRISNIDLEESIKLEMSGDTAQAFIAIVKVIQNPVNYFADQLFKSMKGLGTNDNKLIRLMVWRSEIDMEEIKEEFKIISKGQTLQSFIEGDCSGHYRNALLALCE